MNAPTAHALVAFEESFLDDGVKAICDCGWSSPLYCEDKEDAQRDWEQHWRDEEGVTV